MLLAYNIGQSQIMISQYIEAASGTTPKGIEIYNVSGSDIVFSPTNNLRVYLGRNGGACSILSGINITSGTLRANEVWVIGTTNLITYANSNGTNLSGTTDYGFDFNGDDSLQLYLGGALQDVFGTCGSDPGSAWTGGGVSTANNNLQIKDGLCSGNLTGWSDPSTRFDEITDGEDMTGFGNAPTSCCLSTSIWNGSTWSTGTPDLTTEAILDANYDTSSNGNIQACSLTVSSNFDLTIANNTFVEVKNDLTVEANANIYVASQGAFVQNDDSSTITNNGYIEVTKITAPTNYWYEYTAWSSPVAGADIDNGLSESKSNRRYKFLSENFLDATAETNNNNATIAGQDDIDDNGDDWLNVNGSTVMETGVGYASMHDPVGFAGPGSAPYEFSYTFEGAFNNGVISVPVHRNDSELNDTNWNFIGNPYPSAIDADLFLLANDGTTSTADLGGAIFLWSHNTPPASTANGNEQLNFSNNDYAIINGSGETAGGDGTLPIVITSTGHRAIPSGQAFFVGYSNSSPTTSVSGAIATGEVIFNNAMRLTDITANSEFFKGTNSKNTSSSTTIADKLWLDLTSDNGVYNQILIAYVNGATNDDDGLVFDADKYPTSGAALYSTIEGSIKKFAIQGKSSESINEDEIINLGFNSFINAETEYTISIDKLQGDFLDNNTVYLKDDLLDISHNLSDSDYSFTSETGEFKERFQIVFKEDTTLSVSDIATNENTLQIIQLDNDQVNFKTGTSETIKSIIIYDLYGRKLYQFEGQNSSETFRLSNINTAVYIAQVQLSNNAVITKKAIKR